MRKMFNGIKSVPCVEAKISIENRAVEAQDGYKILIRIYRGENTRDPTNNPPTFLTVGEHDFLKIETLGYGVKLNKAGVETEMVLYKGFGHAYFDNAGVYPQTEDCVEEMGKFILKHC